MARQISASAPTLASLQKVDFITETDTFANTAANNGFADADAALTAYLNDSLNGTVSNVQYTGAATAGYFVDTFTLANSNEQDALFISSGELPSDVNDSTNYSVSHGNPGDDQLTATVQAAFPDAGATRDAAFIEFTVTINDAEVDGISFDVIFGSEEFPEFSGTQFADIAAIYVNGVNVALFNDDPSSPLSIIDSNLAAGNYVDNTSGIYPIQYDGFSNTLSIRSPLEQGENTIKIGVADTGDFIYDSGLLVSDIELLSGGAAVVGILNTVDGTDGNDAVQATTLKEEINLSAGADTVSGTSEELNGDVITGFGDDDAIVFNGASFGIEDVQITLGSAILDIDTDGDGTADTKVTLEGNFEDAEFVVTSGSGGTQVSLGASSGATAGADDIMGTSAADTIDGLGGNDTIKGFGGADTLAGGDGNDKVQGGGGNDEVSGGAGRDKLNGQKGADTLTGDAGRDKLKGGGGADRLDGGVGNDVLNGGKGADVFVFASGNDKVKDFGRGNDKLEIGHPAFGATDSVTAFLNEYADQVGEDVVFDFGGGNTLTLQGVELTSLSASDFL